MSSEFASTTDRHRKQACEGDVRYLAHLVSRHNITTTKHLKKETIEVDILTALELNNEFRDSVGHRH